MVLSNMLSHQDMLAIYHLEHMEENKIIITINCNSMVCPLCVYPSASILLEKLKI